MSHFASLSNETSIMIKKYQDTVLLSLKDSDISIRRRALDLLYGMCDKNTCKHIVAELLSYLQTADYAIREELVIKIANLAEKFASNYSWYVDVILQLITTAGDFVSDDIWFRVVKIVTNHEDIQAYAASTVFNALQSRNCHETLIKVGGYILGEFGHLIADNPQSSPLVQFNILHSKFNTCGAPTKALLLSTYAKFVNLFPELTQQTQEVFKQHQSYIDAEIQQRACEYLNLTSLNEDLMQTVLDVIPAFIDAKDNSNTTSNTANNSNMINSQDSKISSGGFNQSPQPSQQQQQQQPPQQQQAQLQQNVSSNGLDLLDPFGLGLGNQQQQQQQPVQQAQPVYQQQQQAESFSPVQSDTVSSFGQQQQQQQGGFSSPTIQASSSPISSGGSDPMQIKILASYKRLCLVSEGVLYEDSMLQVGLKSEYQSGQGRLMLYYGNSSAFPLTNFNVTLNSIAGLTLQPQSIAPVIQPKAQLQQPVTFSCTSEFTESPVITINFLTPGKPITITLRLPIVISKFFEPLRLSSGDFFARWKTISGKPLEIQEIFKSTKPIDIQSYNRVIQEGLNITVLKQVDPNPNNIVASCLFPFGSNGQPINSYIRIETNPQANMCRLTIRSQSATLTNTIKNLLISHLQ